MKLFNAQRGMTLIGWLLTLVLIGYFVLLVLRLAPGYLEYLNVAKTLESLQSESTLADMTTAEIRSIIGRRFDVNDVHSIKPKDVAIDKQRGQMIIGVDYEVRAPMLGNVFLVTHFKKQIEAGIR